MNKELEWYPPKEVWLGNDEGCPPFDTLNRMLYDAVEGNPSNINQSQIVGKLMLIGRTYSASVERRRVNGQVKDDRQALEVVIAAAEAIAQSQVESLLSAIGVDERLTLARVSEAARIHLEMCNALAKANGRENSSLASKYLHFHRPHFFPIVDSYVREGWSWVMDAKEESYRGWRILGRVAKYGEWCEKILDLKTDIERICNCSISLRQVDNYLLSIMSIDGQGGWGMPGLSG